MIFLYGVRHLLLFQLPQNSLQQYIVKLIVRMNNSNSRKSNNSQQVKKFSANENFLPTEGSRKQRQ